ncbi:MAG: hypothetical protein COX17_08745 [Deltaproteobacteria bacterium CG23_combo_of_CG06-09_8_20_14_all_60_8]|nr:MAG: hypothetical protein COX17_08745 [Deltaproteobacteria bacterium CG23_combo_of_CG06-09_8_20_14_all_60_8]
MRKQLFLVCGAALFLGGAAFHWFGQSTVLLGLMLFLPLLDRGWSRPPLPLGRAHVAAWIVLSLVAFGLLAWQPARLSFFFATLALAALPEEWFFRAWFMSRLGCGFNANLAASLLFSLVHVLAQGPMRGVLVFVPSLAYGWLFQKSREDLPLVVLAHALSNLVYVMVLVPYEQAMLARFGL